MFSSTHSDSCCLLLGFDLRSAQVVSLATGTKCLDSDSVSDRGGTLSDCHAEVVNRRALVRFLYAQLELLLRYDPEALPDIERFLYVIYSVLRILSEVFSFSVSRWTFHLLSPLKSVSRLRGTIHLRTK